MRNSRITRTVFHECPSVSSLSPPGEAHLVSHQFQDRRLRPFGRKGVVIPAWRQHDLSMNSRIGVCGIGCEVCPRMTRGDSVPTVKRGCSQELSGMRHCRLCIQERCVYMLFLLRVPMRTDGERPNITWIL